MPAPSDITWHHVLATHRDAVLKDWIAEQLASTARLSDLLSEADLRRESTEFLALLVAAAEGGAGPDLDTAEWAPVRDFLAELSRARVQQHGFSPSETAVQVFSLKKPLFKLLQDELPDTEGMLTERWAATALDRQARPLHRRGLPEEPRGDHRPPAAGAARAVDAGRQAVGRHPGAAADRHARQRPHPGGDGDPAAEHRRHRRRIAIIDITGVPTVDTLVAQHLLKTVAAARLMGADCIISGIRPQIAQTMVHLGVDFDDVVTKGSTRDALRRAFRQLERDGQTRDASVTRAAMERIPILKTGRLPAGHHPGRHARPARAGAAGRPDRPVVETGPAAC